MRFNVNYELLFYIYLVVLFFRNRGACFLFLFACNFLMFRNFFGFIVMFIVLAVTFILAIFYPDEPKSSVYWQRYWKDYYRRFYEKRCDEIVKKQREELEQSKRRNATE